LVRDGLATDLATRYFMAAIHSVEWEEAAWSRVVEIEAYE
jgi:hypothetical protein